MLCLTSTELPWTPSAPVLPWLVRYAVNFPSGQPVRMELEYSARNAAGAVRQFQHEMNRSKPSGCSVLLVSVVPCGVLND